MNDRMITKPAGGTEEPGNCAIALGPMELSDLPQVLEIERETYSLPWSMQTFADALSGEYYRFIKASLASDGTLAGYCGYLRSFEIADITNVTVRKECRRRGMGEMMLRRLLDDGHAEGIERFSLEVRSSNAAAISLYEKLGFRTEGVRRGYYENPREDALIMWTPVSNLSEN